MTRRRWVDGSWQRRIMRNIYNLNSFCFAWPQIKFTGRYDLPVLKPTRIVPESVFPYDERDKWKPGAGAIHFFCEDCEFESVWLRANRHPHMPAVVQKAGIAFTPDFSIYTDYPKATQIWNTYRSRLLGAIWQTQGITVIPSVTWGDAETLDWIFDGLPNNSVLGISTNHISREEEFGAYPGFERLCELRSPAAVLVVGRGLKELEAIHPNVIRYHHHRTLIRSQQDGKTAASKVEPVSVIQGRFKLWG